jgi:tetratricopeptide (TPR) repeat protein
MIPSANAAMGTGLIRRKIMMLLVALALLPLCAQTAKTQEANDATTEPAQSPETHLGKGYEALKQDRYEEAVQEFRAALAADPTLVLRARFPLAVALFESHKPDDARREFENVRREIGNHPNVLYYLGRLDLDNLDFAGAIRELNKAAVKPPFPDTAYYLGYAYFKQGDLSNAEKWLKEAARLNPRDSRIPYQLGFLYRKQGLGEKAKKSMALSQQLRARDTNESKIKTECGEKLDQGPREQARAICDQLYDADNAEKLTALGTLYGQHGDLEAALKPLQRAAELAPQAPQMQYNLALTYFQLNQLENARKPLAIAIKRWPDLFQLNSLYGAVLMKLGELLPAHETLRHAHQLNPQDSTTADMLYATTFDLGRQSQNAGQYPDSLRYFAEATELRPKEPGPHRHMAEIYILTGQAAEAQAEQEKADQLAKNAG